MNGELLTLRLDANRVAVPPRANDAHGEFLIVVLVRYLDDADLARRERARRRCYRMSKFRRDVWVNELSEFKSPVSEPNKETGHQRAQEPAVLLQTARISLCLH